MLRFQRNSGFKLLFWWAFQPRGRFFSFHACLFVKFSSLIWSFSNCFVCSFVKLDTYLAYLSQISLYSTDMTPNSRNLKKNTYSPALACANFKCHFIFHSGSSKRNFCCKEHSCKSKIVKVSNFPPDFHEISSLFLSLYSNDMTPKQKFQIFSPLFVCLLSWTHIWHILLQSPCIRTIWHQFNFLNFFLFDLVCYYFIFHSGFSKRNFWCKEHCSSSKIGKVTAIWRYFYNSSADQFASNLT